jgi:cellulose synthase/poly-beta-1,6-N-acetylglucosamine synthase-like glycosyltransferase
MLFYVELVFCLLMWKKCDNVNGLMKDYFDTMMMIKDVRTQEWPKVSVLIPCYNEAETIAMMDRLPYSLIVGSYTLVVIYFFVDAILSLNHPVPTVIKSWLK